MKRILLGFAFAAVASNAATVADEIKAARDEIASNRVDRTVWCRYYQAWYLDQCTESERAAILERNIAAHRRLIELEPGNPAHHADLGRVYASVGRWKDAKPELEVALAQGSKLDAARRTSASWEMANCLWMEDDRAGAKKLLAEIAAMKPAYSIPPYHDMAMYLNRADADLDGDLDNFRLPHSVDGKPFPTPQEAKYGEVRVSLAKVEIKLGTNGTDGTDGTSPASRISPVSPEDPIVRLLKKKLTRFGVKFAPGGTPIEIELSPNAPVDKPQGYSLDVADGKVVVKARDRLGLAYGVVSLIQCVERRDRPSICEMAVRDWPVCLRRGVLYNWQTDYLEFALFSKMSCMECAMDFRRREQYVLSPLEEELYRKYAARFNDFGLEVFVDTAFISVRPCMPLTTERAKELHLKWARFLASCGFGLTMMFDDTRFPVPKIDLDAAGSAANIDSKFITWLYHETKKDHPGFRMMFCPPFYWGPDGGVNYPEPRDEYLRSIGRDLDPEIDVYWTGPRVKSYTMTPDRVEWYASRIGRKPSIFHNADCIGRHNFNSYAADIGAWKENHGTTNFFSSISVFHQNTQDYKQGSFISQTSDWCWNPVAHDAATAARRGIEQLSGPGVFEAIAEGTKPLSYFDRYVNGRARSELLTEDVEHIEKLLAEADAAWQKALSLSKSGDTFFATFGRTGLEWARNLVNMRKDPPKWLVEQAAAEKANNSYAKAEMGFDESKGDLFLPAEAIGGGDYYPKIQGDTKKDRAPCGVKEILPGTALSGKFTLEPFPPERPVTLYIMGMLFIERWDRPLKVPPPAIEVEVNGRVIYKGQPFTRHDFDMLKVEIPVDALSRTSTFAIRNAGEDVVHRGRPMVHYVVVRK